MKMLCIIMGLLLVVTGIAVAGSRAQPLEGASVGFLQCAGDFDRTADLCLAILPEPVESRGRAEAQAGSVEARARAFGVDGDDLGLPRIHVVMRAAYGLGAARGHLKMVMAHVFGGGGTTTPDPHAMVTLFDVDDADHRLAPAP